MSWTIFFAMLSGLPDLAVCKKGTALDTGSIEQLAMTPPLLLVRGLLSVDECKELMHVARYSPGFESSSKATTAGNPGALGWQQALSTEEGKISAFSQYDLNKDGLLHASEVALFLAQGWNMPNHNHSALRRAVKKTIARSEGGRRRRRELDHVAARHQDTPLTLSEFTAFDWVSYDQQLRRKKPHYFARYSNQVRLSHQHPAVRRLQWRLAQVAGLSEDVFAQSEEMLVVSYPDKGHYSCHSDNSEEDGAYPHRYLTAEVFLNEAYEGGEVVFPYADSAAERESWRALKMQCSPTDQCLANHSSSRVSGALVVKPKRGDALIWDNVEAGGMREEIVSLLPQGLHAGCEVRKGKKWIAIQWAWAAPVLSSGKIPKTTQARNSGAD